MVVEILDLVYIVVEILITFNGLTKKSKLKFVKHLINFVNTTPSYIYPFFICVNKLIIKEGLNWTSFAFFVYGRFSLVVLKFRVLYLIPSLQNNVTHIIICVNLFD